MHNSQKQERQADKRVENAREFAGSQGRDGATSIAAQPEPVTALAPERETRPLPEAQPRAETILVVEDEDAVRRIACTILRRHGYTVVDAATPRRACEIFGEIGKDIDLLLTDVVMPEMNGPSLAQRLVGERPELRVLFMSGYVDVGGPFQERSHLSLLNKPFQSSTLLAKVQEALTRSRSAE